MGIEPARTTWGIYIEHTGHWLTVGQLAKKLNVHPDTIRRWSNIGRIKSIRHPVNKYRLFLDSDFNEVKFSE